MKQDLKFLFNTLLIATLFALFVIFSLISGVGVGGKAYADVINGYSNVLDDLQKDETFNINDYPSKSDDYSLQVIQIAESTGGELLIYVYQPCAGTRQLTATEIRLSQSIGENIAPKDYKLSLLSRDGVFCKYLVNDLVIKKDVVRYYDLICIFRPFCSDIDKSTGNDNVINSVQYEVAKLYTACTVNGVVTYSCEVEEVVTVTDKYCDFLRYINGYDLWGKGDKCDSHYVAFSCDYDIETLYSATVSFVSQSSHYYFGRNSGTNGITTLGEKEDKTVSLKYSDVVSNTVNGLFGHKYVWNRIESVATFIDKENLSDETINQLENKQWVLRFYETEVTEQNSGSIANGTYSLDRYSTYVSDVSILRLHFKSNGVVYNLGVVDNKQSEDDKQGNVNPDFNFWQWLADLLGIPVWAIKLIVYGVLVLLLGGILLPVLSAIFPVIGQVIKTIFGAVWWLISAPFKGIAWVFKKIFRLD